LAHLAQIYSILDADEILFLLPLCNVSQLYLSVYRGTVFGGVTVLWRDHRYKWYVVDVGALLRAQEIRIKMSEHVFIISKLRHSAPISQRLRASATCVTHS